MGCHSLLQGHLPDPGRSPGLPHGRQIPPHLSHQGKPQYSFDDTDLHYIHFKDKEVQMWRGPCQ